MTQSSTPKSARILIVDDEPAIREFVERTLQAAGHQTRTAASGPDAIGTIDSGATFDLLLTDLRMPGMTGDELARRVRQRQPELKVLYLTGFSDQLFDDKGALWEGEAFLDKPVTAHGLLQAVSLLLYGGIADNRARRALQDVTP